MKLGVAWIGQQGINSHRVFKKHLGHNIRLEHEKYPDLTAIYVFCTDCAYAILKIDKLGNIHIAERVKHDETH